MRAAHAAAGARSGSEAAGPRFLLFQSGRTMAPSLAGMPGSFRVFTKAEMDEPVDEIIASIGELGNGTTRQLGIAFGPLSFDMTDAQLRMAIGNAFAIAERKNVAVAFHIDDLMFWYNRADLWSNRNNVEWSDWNGTVVPHRIIGWVLDGRPVLAPPMCYNSPAIKAEAERLAREVIGAEIRRGLEHLYGIGKPYLFAGVIAGWETRLQDELAATSILWLLCFEESRLQRGEPPGGYRCRAARRRQGLGNAMDREPVPGGNTPRSHLHA